MKTKILFANLLGLQIKDMQHSMALGQVFSQIDKNNINSFYEFCKMNKHKYKKEIRGTMLINLYDDFIVYKNNLMLPYKQSERFSDTLIRKLSYVINDIEFIISNEYLIKDSKIVFKGLFSWDIYKDTKPFTKAEKNALNGLGTASYVIESYRTGAIKDDLIDLYMQRYVADKKNKALSTGEKKVFGILKK